MKDFISKVTFGFLMAQLVPGMVVAMAVTCIGESNIPEIDVCLRTMLDHIEDWWFASAFRTITFLFLSCAIGMLIHTLNWMVLAWTENRDSPLEAEPVRERWYHALPFWIQLLNGPPVMVSEVLSLLRAPNLTCLTMDENVKSLDQNSEWQFQFLQEFYLHFGQFYAHTAYALLLTTILCVVNVFRRPCARSLAQMIVAYFVTSILFLLGRVQLSSLFKGENELAQGKHREGGGSAR